SNLGQTKIQQVGLIGRVDENVGRLEVTVNDAALVSMMNRVTRDEEHIEDRAELMMDIAALIRPLIDGDAIDPFHDQDRGIHRSAVAEGTDNVGMVDCGDGFEFALE